MSRRQYRLQQFAEAGAAALVQRWMAGSIDQPQAQHFRGFHECPVRTQIQPPGMDRSTVHPRDLGMMQPGIRPGRGHAIQTALTAVGQPQAAGVEFAHPIQPRRQTCRHCRGRQAALKAVRGDHDAHEGVGPAGWM